MPDVPYTPTVPTTGAATWDVPLDAAINATTARINVHESGLGVFLDSFTGANDDAKLVAAMAYAQAQTYLPAIVLGDRIHTFAGGPYPFYNGFRLVGSMATMEREFLTTGPQCVATVSSSALFSVPTAGVKNVWISGIQFRASTGSVNWLTPVADLGAGPIINDAVFERCAWFGYNSIMQARHLRCHIERTYINGGTGTQLQLAGSDNTYWSEGKSFMSSVTLPASSYFVYFVHMSRTRVGANYITPCLATGVRIDNTFGDLQFDGTLFDGTGQSTSTGCQGAAILITGGEGYVFNRLWFFNNCVNPAGAGRTPQDKGQVYIKAGANMLFQGCAWGGPTKQAVATPSGTPAIYAASGVTGIKVSNPLAPYAGVKLLQQATTGIITCDDPTWAINVA